MLVIDDPPNESAAESAVRRVVHECRTDGRMSGPLSDPPIHIDPLGGVDSHGAVAPDLKAKTRIRVGDYRNVEATHGRFVAGQ